MRAAHLEGLHGHHDGVVGHEEAVTQPQVDAAKSAFPQLLDEGDLVATDMTYRLKEKRTPVKMSVNR